MDAPARFQSFDLLATLVAVVQHDAGVIFANSALEDAMGISKRSIVGSCLADAFTEPALLQNALRGLLTSAEAAPTLQALNIVGFEVPEPGIYQRCVDMRKSALALGYPLLA